MSAAFEPKPPLLSSFRLDEALLRVHRAEQARLLREAAAALFLCSSEFRRAFGELESVLSTAPSAETFGRGGSWPERARRATRLARRDRIAVPGELVLCLAQRESRSATLWEPTDERARALLARAQELDPDPQFALWWGLGSLLRGEPRAAERLAHEALRDARLVLVDRPDPLRAALELLRALAWEELGQSACALAPLERAASAGLGGEKRRVVVLDALGLSLALAAGELHAARVAAVRLAAPAARASNVQRLAHTVAARRARRPPAPAIAVACWDFARRVRSSRNTLAAAVVAAVAGPELD